MNSAPIGTVKIVGNLVAGYTLSIDSTLWDDDGFGALHYTWLRDGIAFGAPDQPTYLLTAADIGYTFTVIVSYVDQGGTPEAVTSNTTAAVDPATSTFMNPTPPSGLNTIVGLPGTSQDLLVGTAGADLILGGPTGQVQHDGYDKLYGNDGDDWLDGGDGGDTMTGGNGNDTYIVDNSGDKINEGASQGFDTVYSSVNWVLGTNLENLILTGQAVSGQANGVANILYGNDNGNLLRGEAGNDTIRGYSGNDTIKGGNGNDLLTGGVGADRFVFDGIPNPTTNVDTITDFVPGQDKIDLVSFMGFYNLPPAPGNTLDPLKFVVGTAALDANDRVIYNDLTGQLFYDSNGSSAGQMVLVATLVGAPTLASTDFIIS